MELWSPEWWIVITVSVLTSVIVTLLWELAEWVVRERMRRAKQPGEAS